jgi:hypothetical protein
MKIPDAVLVVARHLGDLRERVVFVGGMIRSLLVTDPAAGRARPTDDVDLIVDVTRAEYFALQLALRRQRFREASEEGAVRALRRTLSKNSPRSTLRSPLANARPTGYP